MISAARSARRHRRLAGGGVARAALVQPARAVRSTRSSRCARPISPARIRGWCTPLSRSTRVSFPGTATNSCSGCAATCPRTSGTPGWPPRGDQAVYQAVHDPELTAVLLDLMARAPRSKGCASPPSRASRWIPSSAPARWGRSSPTPHWSTGRPTSSSCSARWPRVATGTSSCTVRWPPWAASTSPRHWAASKVHWIPLARPSGLRDAHRVPAQRRRWLGDGHRERAGSAGGEHAHRGRTRPGGARRPRRRRR